MTLCQPASSQLNPTYIRMMNHTGASRVSENKSLAMGWSATMVSLWTMVVDTWSLLFGRLLRGAGRRGVDVPRREIGDGRDDEAEGDAGDQDEAVEGRTPVRDGREDAAAGERLAREVRPESRGHA